MAMKTPVRRRKDSSGRNPSAEGSTDGFEALRSRLVSEPSGRLSLNGQAMILLPRHFFRYILREVRAVAGPEAFRRIFTQAGHDGAVTFCRRFQQVHGSTAREAVEGYLQEMSLRGWGRFSIRKLDPQKGYLEVLLQDSALVAEEGLPSGNLLWEASMQGALAYLLDSSGITGKGSLRARGEEVSGEANQPPGFRIVVSRESKSRSRIP